MEAVSPAAIVPGPDVEQTEQCRVEGMPEPRKLWEVGLISLMMKMEDGKVVMFIRFRSRLPLLGLVRAFTEYTPALIKNMRWTSQVHSLAVSDDCMQNHDDDL